MPERILIVEDEFIIANDLRLLLEQAGFEVSGIAASVVEARELLRMAPPDIVLLDILLKGNLSGIDLALELRSADIPFVYLSANSNRQILEQVKLTDPAGFLVKPFREKDVLVTLEIARYRHAHKPRPLGDGRSSLLSALAELAARPGTAVQWDEILCLLQQGFPFDLCTIASTGAGQAPGSWQGFRRTARLEYQALSVQGLAVVANKPEPEVRQCIRTARPGRIPFISPDGHQGLLKQDRLRALLASSFELASELSIPLFEDGDSVTTLSFFSRSEDAYHPEDVVRLLSLQNAIAGLVRNRADEPGHATPDPAPATGTSDSMIGASASLDEVMALVAQVAPADTSVLILGESGTGKERIADRLHALSGRRGKPLVKVNCAALPPNLIESELFGHEKGAFTGATERRPGKFEQANGGSIFLDEIGEMSPDQQVKLLRVLQEREIERIGGKERIRLDVRVIAATNRNLEREVAEGRFRLDLYYRLNVFPIQLPPLRERRQDIPLLAEFFAKDFCRKMKKDYNGISPDAVAAMQAYAWPGNVRELENVMEQAVIMNAGPGPIALGRRLGSAAGTMQAAPQSLDAIQAIHRQSEKAYIAAVLRQTKGRIRGAGGAAELLQEKPTTLESRMLKLGIRKEEFLG